MIKPTIVGNWKMNSTLIEASELAIRMKPGLVNVNDVEIVVCPPFISMSVVRDVFRGSSIHVGAQDMYHEASGAFTGEISPKMLADLCRYVILGHSERRHLFGETDRSVSRKVVAAQAMGLRSIVCVGEALDTRENGEAEDFVAGQVIASLSGLETLKDTLVAYEPIWAIGTGKAASPENVQDMVAHIRVALASEYGNENALDVSILYGGSVTASNVSDFLSQPDVNGALVGGASLNADTYVQLVQRAVMDT